MATASAKPRLTTIRLLEERPLGGRVDRQRGIIYSVKIVGRTSPNTHGVRGVDGTEYTLEALRKAARLYEGINCNVDHPPRSRPDEERSAYTRFAWLENVRVKESGLYGDLHFLDAGDPLAVKMLNAAEDHPEAYALSHNASGKGEVRNRKYVIHEIPEVRSVDIVADGGTNRSLFEGRQMSKVTVHEVLRTKVLGALQAGRKKRLQRLLETALTEERSPLMEAADGEDHRDHMYKAMRSCEEAGNEEGAKGIHKLLDPEKRKDEEEEEDAGEEDEEKEEGAEEEDVEEGMGEEGPGEPGEHNEGPTGKGGPATAWESRRRKKRKLAPGVVRLTESRALQMCQAAGIECTADVMEAMKGADFDQALRIVKLAKRGQRPGSAPRSSTPSATGSAPIPRNLKEWAESLRG